MANKYYIAIPAYNEEKTIDHCLKFINDARKFAAPKFLLENTFICLNGCTDNTEIIVKEISQELPKLNIEILISEKGMNRAIGKIIDCIPSGSSPIIQIDADAMPDKKSFLILLTELKKHSELQIVGGYPQALNYRKKNLYKKLLSNVLDVRSRWPRAQMAVKDTSAFHEIADVDPQSNISQEFEKKSRIYFHGRFYLMKNKRIWDVPSDRIGDDTYLTLSIYKRFGYDSIRIRYDAICHYQPTTSLIQHWKTYKRIHCDVETLFNLSVFRRLQKLKSLEKVKLDWAYIQILSRKIRFYFLCYGIVKFIEEILFKIFPKYSKKLWFYKTKKD